MGDSDRNRLVAASALLEVGMAGKRISAGKLSTSRAAKRVLKDKKRKNKRARAAADSESNRSSGGPGIWILVIVVLLVVGLVIGKLSS